jgi:hypothetical protein
MTDGTDMTEQEAVAIATAYLTEQAVPFKKFEQAIFIPASAHGPDAPYAKDSWAVYFDDPTPGTEGLSCSGPLIVSVDPITGQAHIVMLL